MKLSIFCGGTGSESLQKALYLTFGDALDVYTITNAYDNGKSTGLVRTVFEGDVLGPSDVRKNQLLRYELKDGQPYPLEHRFSCDTSEAYNYCNNFLHSNVSLIQPQHFEILQQALDYYFLNNNACKITYEDFSFLNIIYASLAKLNGNSLEKAASIMADILGIEDNVILSSDESLFLTAETKSGFVILDEGDIVKWNNPDDPIIKTYLTNLNNKIVQDIRLSDKAKRCIIDSDILVISSGTVWSSLIPTFQCAGFINAVMASKAYKNKKIFCVINNDEDYDMTGQGAIGHVNAILNFFSKEHTTFLFNSNKLVSKAMTLNNLNKNNKLSTITDLNIIEKDFGYVQRLHDGFILTETIFKEYYREYMKNPLLIFDYDDTINGRNNTYKRISSQNKMMFLSLSSKKNVAIISGNSFESINIFPNNLKVNLTKSMVYPILIIADASSNYKFIDIQIDENHNTILNESKPRPIDKNLLFTNEEINMIIKTITSNGIPYAKIKNKGNASVSIKPIDNEYRIPIVHLLKFAFEGKIFKIVKTGLTTVEIMKIQNSKKLAIDFIFKMNKWDKDTKVTYVGDEFHPDGNDYELVIDPRIDFLQIQNPKDTNIFLKTLQFN